MTNEFAKVNASAKRPIDIWTNYLYYNISVRFVYLIRNTRISPNEVTLSALFMALIGCVGFANGSRPWVLLGLVFAQISYVLDCADGQLARYRQQFSPIGGWLDQVSDRIKEFAVYFSLAYGYTRQHPGDTRIWVWAMIGLFTLYLLEYYGQIGKQYFTPGTNPFNNGANTDDGGVGPDDEAHHAGFQKLQFWRSFIPFRGFIIGEQYFAMLVFILFNAIYPFFVFVAVVGILMSVYRPAILFYKLRRGLA